MAELRKDYLTDEWVSIAEERGHRPYSFKQVAQEDTGADDRDCPFCLHNKHLIVKDPYTKGEIRAIPNLYPVLNTSSPHGYGYHEVIIDTPNHEGKLRNFSVAQIVDVLAMIKERIGFFSQQEKIKYVQIFKNDGLKAGASIYHSHWQAVGMPVIPDKQLRMYENFQRYYQANESCYLCDTIKSTQELIIFRHGSGVAYVPYAALYAGCINITTDKHVSDFKDMDETTISDMAVVLKHILMGLHKIYENIPYNICFYSGSFYDAEECAPNRWHFYMQIVPRIGSLAGFELSTGCYINSIKPEIFAGKMRKNI